MKYEVKSAMLGYGLVTVLLLGALIAVLVITYGTPAGIDDAPATEVTFATFAHRGEDLLLTATGGEVYKISGVDEWVDPAAFSSLCDGKTEVVVYAKRINPRGETPYFSVKAVYRDGDALLDFSDTDRLERAANLPTVLVLGGMTVIWGVVLTFAILLGRSPDRFDPRLVRLFFRERVEEAVEEASMEDSSADGENA